MWPNFHDNFYTLYLDFVIFSKVAFRRKIRVMKIISPINQLVSHKDQSILNTRIPVSEQGGIIERIRLNLLPISFSGMLCPPCHTGCFTRLIANSWFGRLRKSSLASYPAALHCLIRRLLSNF